MPKPLRIVFMGTPDFAVASLRYLKDQGHTIVGVITAPDKPTGRGKQIVPPPVKRYALEAGITPILQPPNLKDPGFLATLRSLKADLQVVVAFRMLPEAVWAMPPKGTVNLHASLLPDYRGAAPINWAIINGEKETGVTTFFIQQEIDSGNIIDTDRVTIGPDMTAGELHDTLMNAGARMLDRTLQTIASGNVSAQSQSEMISGKTLHSAPKIFKEDCRINWHTPAGKIHDFIRGLSPYPAAYTEITNGEKQLNLKIFRSRPENTAPGKDKGDLLTDNKNYLKVVAGEGEIYILELQAPGKRRMPVEEFLRGFNTISEYRIVI